jgi:hypothetical protein
MDGETDLALAGASTIGRILFIFGFQGAYGSVVG